MPSLSHPDRRTVLRLIAAGAAAGLAGCSKPDEPIYPRAVDPEGAAPGEVRRYATALSLAGYGRGVTGIVVDGRPIKLEGLDAHPASLGATDLFTETAILDLYDPQRLRAPQGPGGVTGWPFLQRALIARLAGSDGAGLRILSGRITSPALLDRIAAMRRRFPAMRHYRFEPIDDDADRAGATRAFGRPLTMRPRLSKVDVLVTLGADPLGPGPEQVALARGWAMRRLRAGGPQRLHAFESGLTQTGACADFRTAARPGQIANALLHIAAALGTDVASPQLSPPLEAAVARATHDLISARGRAAILVGREQSAPVHALAAWVNQRLSAPIDWIAPVDPDPMSHLAGLAELATQMHAGRVDTLLLLDCDPVRCAPAALRFGEALARVPLSIACARFPSATTAAARWTAPLHDELESWSDVRAPDGTASITQPLIRPLYRTRSALEMIDLVDPPMLPASDHDRLRDGWRPHAGADFDRWWQDALVSGIVAGSAAGPLQATAALTRYPPAPPSRDLQILLAPSPTLWDGRRAANAWAQECPDPLTKEVWGSSLRMAATDAARLGAGDGDVVALPGGEASVRIVLGQAEGVATLLLGYGQGAAAGRIADTGGINGFALRDARGGWIVSAAGLHAPGSKRSVPSTRAQFALDGDYAKLFPIVRPGAALPPEPPRPTLLPRAPAGTPPPQWAMAIDTAVCIGCNACIVACQAENNVPAIGPDEMARNRDMHWLRVDYHADADGSPRGFQPIPCMQCEAAPCEPVCPVEASVHDEQGLNAQVYNRCVGTRTCQANCPYKVRRFNFLDYAGADLWGEEDHGSISAQRNPEVTVRARGVMEKCTYCVQRISAAVREADATGTPMGPVATACQSACPTRAIRFGNMTDPASGIPAARADPRHYALLGELGTRPRTTYLARLRAGEDEA